MISGCKKSDSSGYSAQKLAGTYKMTAATATSGGITIDKFATMPDCEKDDIMKIFASPEVNVEYIDAGTVCGGGTIGNDYSEKLAIKGDLFITLPDTDPDTSTIKSFNGSTLVLSFTENNQSVLVTTTYTKQ
jgi:hypothetical protein